MKIAFIVILYNTASSDIKRITSQIHNLHLADYKMYFIDNSKTHKGYAAGVNEGLQKALADKANVFVIANPDISFHKLTIKDIEDGLKQFDILGFPFQQSEKIFYGGHIDRLRMSGGLITQKPEKQYEKVDFVSGSLMIIKRKVIEKVGYFDESYGMYYEDVDYCYRATTMNLKVGINTKVSYEHYETSDTSAFKKAYLLKNRLRFLIKNGGVKQKIYELIRLPKTVWEERKTLFQILKKRELLFGFMSLNVSSVINKLFNFIIFVVLVHMLSPQNYGIYILVWAQVSLLSPIVDLGTTSYGLLHITKGSQDKISNLYSLRFITAGVIFTATIILSLFFGYSPQILTFIFLTSFIILSNMLSGTLLIVTAVSEKLYIPALLSIIANLIYTIVTIGVLLLFKSLLSIFIVICLFYIGYAFINYLFLKQQIPTLAFTINLSHWQTIIKKSYIYILISLFAGLYFKIDIFLLNFLQGKEAVGIYSSGFKFFEAFMFIVASFTTAATPLYVRLAKGNKQALFKRIQKDAYMLVTIGLLISAITYIVSPFIVPFIVGEKYSDAVKVLQIVITALPFIFLGTILINALYVLEKAYYVVYVFLIQIVVNSFLNFILIPKYSYIASSYISVISEIINTGLFFILIYTLTHIKKDEYID